MMIIFSLMLAILLLVFLGPRIRSTIELVEPYLPADLDDYLARQESRVSNIVDGTEKRIIWRGGQKDVNTSISVVYLHGFSATRQEVAPLCDRLAESLDANLYYTRLSGHGRGGQAMKEATLQAMCDDAVEAMAIGQRIGQKVVLVGNSTGASLCVWLALQARYHSLIHSLILLSPNFGLSRQSEMIMWPWGKYLLRILQGKYYEFEPANAQQQTYWTTRFPSDALIGMMGLIKHLRQHDLASVSSPTLMLYNKRDQVVSVEKALYAFAQLGSQNKRSVEIESANSAKQHVLAGDILSPRSTNHVLQEILVFMDQNGVSPIK